ncbi:SRPBCC family protein [Streptomyces sp. YIM 98790]|uniref:SRPBCC family protein n=1 Tax=Streptomyces sp. YIM 98790 TaxID=2689077 RepID=UPI0014085362|nr:SRPBCC family protein [Streptomyces sp. YIM 98790]
MATRTILVKRPPRAVWALLSDRNRYADWVIGARDSRPLEGDWPEVGASLQYVLKIGPWRLSGRTLVRHSEPPRLLELEAQRGRLGSARIALEVRPWGDASLVILDEHPLTGPGGRMHSPLDEALLQLRHRRMLRLLARAAERYPEPDDPPAGGGDPPPSEQTERG